MVSDQVPQNQTTSYPFEKLKYIIDLVKWLITSVALVLITLIIDTGFRDRESGMKEIAQYDKYVTELLILNKDLASKRSLAQFFSCVTPSGRLAKGWGKYYALVDEEYRPTIAAAKTADSTLQSQRMKLIVMQNLSEADSSRLEKINEKIQQTQSIINPEIVLPGTIVENPSQTWEQKGFDFLLAQNIDEAIIAFSESEKAKPSYHMVYEIRNYLVKNRNTLKDRNNEVWTSTYKWILTKASWGMPNAVKEAMKSRAGA